MRHTLVGVDLASPGDDYTVMRVGPKDDPRRYPTCSCPPDTLEEIEAWWARWADDGGKQ